MRQNTNYIMQDQVQKKIPEIMDQGYHNLGRRLRKTLVFASIVLALITMNLIGRTSGS